MSSRVTASSWRQPGCWKLLVGRTKFWIWMAALTSPAALWTMITSQNAFLNVGLFYGGMRLLDRSPRMAGILLGLLSYKPQLFVLIPVALLAARLWRALAWTIGTAAFMVSPYLINYDLLLMMPAALMVFRRRAEADLYPGELLFYVGLWLIPNLGLGLNAKAFP